MNYIFEITDKTGRKIRFTKKQWSHIRQHHSDIEDPEEILKTLENPDQIFNDERENVQNFYKYFKHKNLNSKFLKVIVRYLNGDGFILTAHFTRSIK